MPRNDYHLISARRCVPKTQSKDPWFSTGNHSGGLPHAEQSQAENRTVSGLWEWQVPGLPQFCSFSWRTTFRAHSLRLSVFSTLSSLHPWQQQDQRVASLLWKRSRSSLMLWLFSPWEGNLSETFLTSVVGSLETWHIILSTTLVYILIKTHLHSIACTTTTQAQCLRVRHEHVSLRWQFST